MEYYGLHNKRYKLGNKLNSGGEGTIFQIQGADRLVAKIYLPRKLHETPEMESKLRVMLRLDARIGGVLAFAFPKDLLYQNGTFVGFVMPKIDAQSIICAVRPMERILLNPQYNTLFSVTVALNLAERFLYLEKKNIIVGDANLGNLLVDEKGFVYLVDTDSWTITAPDGRRYATTPGGVARYLPPECMKGKICYNMYTDRYVMALWLFLLLQNGCHPFSGENIEENIACKRSPYFTANGEIPAESPDIRWMGKTIVSMFRAAFVGSPQQRPSAGMWVAELKKLLQQLCTKSAVCLRDPRHYYLRRYTPICPWCAVERRQPSYRIPGPPSVSAKGSRPNGCSAAAEHLRLQLQPKRPGTAHAVVCYGAGLGAAAIPMVCNAYRLLAAEMGAGLPAWFAMAMLILCGAGSAGLVRHWLGESYRRTGHPWFSLAGAVVLVAVLLAALGMGTVLVLSFLCFLWRSLVGFLASQAGTDLLLIVIGGIFLYLIFKN